jgi:hypothetical protein
MLTLPRYAIGNSMDLSSVGTHVSKLADGTNSSTRISSIISVKTAAAPVKRKAAAMDEDTSGDKNKKTRRGGGKKMKK